MFNILRQKPPSSPSRSKAQINDEDDALTGEGLTKEAIKAHVPGSLRKAKVRTGHVCVPAREGHANAQQPDMDAANWLHGTFCQCFGGSILCVEVYIQEPGGVLRQPPPGLAQQSHSTVCCACRNWTAPVSTVW